MHKFNIGHLGLTDQVFEKIVSSLQHQDHLFSLLLFVIQGHFQLVVILIAQLFDLLHRKAKFLIEADPDNPFHSFVIINEMSILAFAAWAYQLMLFISLNGFAGYAQFLADLG